MTPPPSTPPEPGAEATTRRRLIAGMGVGVAATSGCAGLLNDAVDLAVENRSDAERRVVADVTPAESTSAGTAGTTAEGTPEATPTADPDYEGSLPPGSRAIDTDVVAGDGERAVTVSLLVGESPTARRLTVTPPGVVEVCLRRDGPRIWFQGRD